MESLFHLCMVTNQNMTSSCFSVSPKIFCCSSPVVFHNNNVHFPSSCLLGDYPLTAGMGSICQPCNLLRYDVLKNKCCCCCFLKKCKATAKTLPLVCLLEADSVHLEIKEVDDACHRSLKGEVIKSQWVQQAVQACALRFSTWR